MDIRKIKTEKKASGTVTGLVITLILITALFFGLFEFWNTAMNNGSVEMDSLYSNISNDITDSSRNISKNVDDIKENVDSLQSADETVVAQLWNGIKGLGNLIKFPLVFVNNSWNIFTYFVQGLIGIPPWVTDAAGIAIVAYVVFLVFKAVKGEPAL